MEQVTESQTFKRGQQIKAGSWIISIGAFNTRDVAIISISTGKFVELSRVKNSKRLRRAKRKFKSWLCCNETFCFCWFTPEMTIELIDILKGK